MFVITVDQVGSRAGADRVAHALALLAEHPTDGLLLPAERTAGDEFELLGSSGGGVLRAALLLLRDGAWSVGIGIGAVEEPLPDTIRAARGPALVAARDAVERAKHRQTRFAVRHAHASREEAATDAQALTDLLLALRSGRSAEGWAVLDLVARGATQAAAAKELGISPQAVSQRAAAAQVRADLAALPALERMFDAL